MFLKGQNLMFITLNDTMDDRVYDKQDLQNEMKISITTKRVNNQYFSTVNILHYFAFFRIWHPVLPL